ncbi:3 beta-hydroxysteroid dehydrogenase type 3 [Hondaea fermentalgiana]|uniref:3 beta-hydroxysteroid dehydrogenase type 3 n=1 Tax=Hondaea fermentalgiana TaxID=2315210 RepID=A0A2R5G4H6_9STRA|nr:3 beta-hydroxysteroid dehydrogenase type 3 [Hondaea fermentalgiana]|eukprot:GBG25927.1 3 beta-hydroxysteroid dehydrogenase type 3 [Hondaea fermentalgiana]
MRTDAKSVSFMWWIFIGMQVSLSVTAFVVTIVASLTASQGNALVRMTTVSLVMWTQAAAVATTHALGGKWRHIETSYAAFQPGRGGLVFIALQIAGWGALGVSIVMGLLVFGSQAVRFQGKTPLLSDHLMAVCGFLGLVAEAFVVASVFYYKESDETDGDVAKSERAADMWSRLFLRVMRMQIATVNLVFGPRDIENITRKPALQDPGAHWACDERWKEAMRLCPRTGDSYLVVGNGFVGKRIVLELLDRGETDVRVFDIVPDSSWDNEPRVSFILGDVTKADQIGPACAGVNTVYSTFAIIRFMERLEHQAFLSYHVNVTGTEVLLEACRSASVARVIVTSSSHATTDEHSAPRFDRDEDAPLLTREEAHNHYGWTKAIADELALKADGSRLENGNELQVVVVRPCSGVFGADDRLSFERVMDIGIAPGVGTKAVMDWVPVQSVVQGHLLAEQALQDGRAGVRGEAFCISNDDPTSMEDFWWLTIKYIRQLPLRQRERLHIDVLYVPEGIFWALAYLSELNAWLFRGKLSLGRDLDMLTPAMLSTATMSYTYSSAKARRVLGYNPVFSLDEAIQRAIHEYSVARGAI